jgi:hypothetical protein
VTSPAAFAVFAAFAEGPASAQAEAMDHAAFAAYSEGSGPEHRPNGTRPTGASKATEDHRTIGPWSLMTPHELTLPQLQMLLEVLQSQLSHQARKAEDVLRPTSPTP